MRNDSVRLRICFDKHGKIRFTSHRDVARIWERTLRRARLPVEYSEGFSPRPRLSFGLALSTGHESNAEYLDVELDPSRLTVDIEELADELTAHLPVGMTVRELRMIDRTTPSLQQAVTSCTWQIDVADTDADTVTRAVAHALAADTLIVTRERKGKQVTDDLRPLVLGIDVIGPIEVEHRTDSGTVRLIAELGTQPRAVRVSELLAALDPPLEERRVQRLHQWIMNDEHGRRGDPLRAAVPLTPVVAT